MSTVFHHHLVTKGCWFRKSFFSWSQLCRTYYSSLSQANSTFLKLNYFKSQRSSQIQCFSVSASTKNLICEKLVKRSLLHVTGPDSANFLQGVITNDINSLTDVMYSLILNTQGRVLYDVILYNIGKSLEEKSSFLIECDAVVNEDLQKHLKMYKLRKKVEISSINSELTPWVLLPTCSEIKPEISKEEQVICVKDPRVDQLGWRLICKKGVSGVDVSKHTVCSSDGCDEYSTLRYRLGIGEGIDDLPVGNCFPLESNADYLHGVSFRKGCYIGQELTARTFHTGVVRKRLMPVTLEEVPLNILSEVKIQNENGKNVGKFRRAFGKFGLGVLRISESLASKSLSVVHGNTVIKLTTSVPNWWPSSDSTDDQP